MIIKEKIKIFQNSLRTYWKKK